METLPYLTQDLPGIGGVIKDRPEDFVVEEIPAYEPSGEGTHLYLDVEKRGITTHEAVRRIARAAGKQPRDVGYAGLKDAAAVTRQRMSIEHVSPEVMQNADLGWVTIRSISRHTNKIKLGHHRGNRFIIKVRDCDAGETDRVRAIVNVLSLRGMPNYFGPQRFGVRGDNWLVGRAAIKQDFGEALAVMLGRPYETEEADVVRARRLFDQGEWDKALAAWPKGFPQQRRILQGLIRAKGDARRAWRAVDRSLRSLFLSAYQSYLFNLVVADRIESLDRVECGDMAYRHANGACFRVEDADVEQPRCDAQEISPTGPLYGRRMTRATEAPGEREAQLLSDTGLTIQEFTRQDGIRLDGARRPLRVPVGETQVTAGGDEQGTYVELAFSLPPGSYATCLTREVCK